MTKEHYEAFAEEIAKEMPTYPEGAAIAAIIIHRVAQRFNSNFDPEIFHGRIFDLYWGEKDLSRPEIQVKREEYLNSVQESSHV